MARIILDCDLMKFPNSGLYHYCLNLGRYVNKHLNTKNGEQIKFYVPEKEKNSFGNADNCIVEKNFHRFIKPFLWDCKVWHAPFQSGRILPHSNRSIKVLLTIHDLNPLHEHKPQSEIKKSIAHTQKLIDRSTAIVCISEFCRQDVLANCYVGNKPVYVIHNGTHSVGEPQLHSNSYKPVRPFLFAMGYVNRKKNVHTLVPMLEQHDVELIIAGKLDDDEYVKEINKDAERRGVKAKLHILGPVSENEKAWYLKNCHAFVQPSLAEGFGAPVVEAMAFGKPVFLSNRTSLPEIGGNVAFYFNDFGPDHMSSVFAEGMSIYNANGLQQKIINRSKQFDWEQKAKQYITVYNSLL